MVSLNMPGFQGDILAVNDETYGSNVTRPCSAAPTRPAAASTSTTSPTRPTRRPLVQGAGDTDPDDDPTDAGADEGPTPTTPCSSGRTARAPTSWPRTTSSSPTSTSSTSPTRRTRSWSPTSTWSSCSREVLDGETGQRRHGPPPRHGREADRRPACAMLVRLLGRRLRAARRDRPGQPGATSPTHFDGPDPLLPVRPARGQRPPGRVLARQPVPPGGRRGLRRPTG